jgi:hypothetical protein
MTVSNELRGVLATAADALEALYKELGRSPPPEGVDLINNLRRFADDFLSNPDVLNSDFKLG